MTGKKSVLFVDVLRIVFCCDIRTSEGIDNVLQFFSDNGDVIMNLSEVGPSNYLKLMIMLKKISVSRIFDYLYYHEEKSTGATKFCKWLHLIDHTLLDDIKKLENKTVSYLATKMTGAGAPVWDEFNNYRKEYNINNSLIFKILDMYRDLCNVILDVYKLLKDLAAEHFTSHTYTLGAREDIINIMCFMSNEENYKFSKCVEFCKMLFDNQTIGILNCIELSEKVTMWGFYGEIDYNNAKCNILTSIEKNTDFTKHPDFTLDVLKGYIVEFLSYKLFKSDYCRTDFLKIFNKLGMFLPLAHYEKLIHNFNKCEQNKYDYTIHIQFLSEVQEHFEQLLLTLQDV